MLSQAESESGEGGSREERAQALRQKSEAARRWCDAINAWGQMGRWQFETCRRKEDVPGLLAKHAATSRSEA
jgi:hypothetical protein